MPGFNRWLNGKNKQINKQKQMEARVFGTPTANPYADPAGAQIAQEAMEGMNTGRPKSGGGRRYSARPAKVATGYGGRVTRRFG